ncbi:nitrate transporter [Choiromyces venosus 120613-1]|uniref:Nitrate/nitrite transporter n=1 Tax=Choiromyces venosus 120613-1 TaxID=1336337 RepID=A0A3N4JV10_9PEZI|nr:nitrate transporter [Choiromyces venosus 120613-1]
MQLSLLWKAPAINPANHKAQSIPVLNPFNKYGRTFYFSTLGFMIAFLSWYAFPPLMTKTIKKDLHLSQAEVANSNVLALTATLVVRLFIGPLCDRYGPRLCFAGTLLAGAIPTFLAGTADNAASLITIRFFVGILGATFVPCQVWSTGFFDKNVVGTANGLMAGIGNAGGGITYFLMPAVFDSLVRDRGMTPHKAWRVAFMVPFILIVATALGMIFLCEDTPTGAWADRHNITAHTIEGKIVDATGHIGDVPTADKDSKNAPYNEKDKKTRDPENASSSASVDLETIVQSEIIQTPTMREAIGVIFSLQSLMLAAPYACSFGGELAINSILGSYYYKNFPYLGQTGSGRWAAMFGLLNVFFRPAGGIISDIIYNHTGSVAAKKFWLVFVGCMQGVFCLAIGLVNAHNEATMFGLVAGLAFFMDASNGANFALVPHVHPFANGILSGVVGAFGNLGGVIFSIIFRYHGTRYDKVIIIIGGICIGINLAISWIRPIPKGQIGGR